MLSPENKIPFIYYLFIYKTGILQHDMVELEKELLISFLTSSKKLMYAYRNHLVLRSGICCFHQNLK